MSLQSSGLLFMYNAVFQSTWNSHFNNTLVYSVPSFSCPSCLSCQSDSYCEIFTNTQVTLAAHCHPIAMAIVLFGLPWSVLPLLCHIPMLGCPWPLSSCGIPFHGHLWSPMPSPCPFIGNRCERQAKPVAPASLSLHPGTPHLDTAAFIFVGN